MAGARFRRGLLDGLLLGCLYGRCACDVVRSPVLSPPPSALPPAGLDERNCNPPMFSYDHEDRRKYHRGNEIPPTKASMTKHLILFLAADPNDTSPRALGYEACSIQEELERSGHRDCFAFETRWATKPLDVLRELRRLKPAVVHFCSHGGQDGLFFQNVDGRVRLVSTAALAETFGATGASVRLVVLSACYSETQAEALLAHVDCVVGMSGSSGRIIAKAYASGFYGGLGEGEPILAAHRQGCAAISLEGLSNYDRPQLKVRDGVDAAGLVLAGQVLEAEPPLPIPARVLALAAERPRPVRLETITRDLVREIYARLLTGDSADALARAARLTEIVLEYTLSSTSTTRATLAELHGEAGRAAREALGTDLLGGLDWIQKLGTNPVRALGKHRGELLEDAERAAELVTGAVLRLGLLDELTVRETQRAAEWQASEPTSTALLRLDRAEQRRSLDDLLALPRRVLVMLFHGEVGQGHDHFGQIATWRTRTIAKGPWRQLHVDWPPPSQGTETRLGFLLESFARAVGLSLVPPPLTPVTGGEAAWTAALAPVLSACDRSRDQLFVRHVLRWLDNRDIELVARYLRMVWIPLAARHGKPLVCCLELRRAERAGMPLSRAWWTARAEHRIAQAIATTIEEQAMPKDGHCAALPELTSATCGDLADWLRAECQLTRSAAMAKAQRLVTMTRGGRFDLVIERLTSLHPDTRSSRR